MQKEISKQSMLKRAFVVIPIVIIFGLLIVYFDYKEIGIAIIVGGVIGLIISLLIMFDINKNNPTNKKRVYYSFFIAAGFLLLIFASYVIITEENMFRKHITEIAIGLLFIIYGSYNILKKN